MNNFQSLQDDLKKWLAERAAQFSQTTSRVATNVGNAGKQVIKTIASQPISPQLNQINKLSGGKTFNPTIGQATDFAADVTVRPIVRVGFEGAQTIAGDKKVYTPKPGFEQTLLGKGELRNYTDPDRTARKIVRATGLPEWTAAPLIVGGVALDVTVPGVDDIVRRGGKEIIEDVAKKELPEIAEQLFKKGSKEAITDPNKIKRFVVSLINKSGGDEMAAKTIDDVVEGVVRIGNDVQIQNFKNAINSQLIRFRKFADNPNAQKFLNSLETGYDRLNEISKAKTTPFKILSKDKQSVISSAKKEVADFMALTRTKTPGASGLTDIIAKEIKDNTISPLAGQIDNLKDITNLRAGFSDIYRNFQQVFGKGYADAKRLLLDPFDAAKGRFAQDTIDWTNKLDAEIVKGLGIKKGSKLSALVQNYGEGKITLDELKAAAPNEWQKVVQADQWFRQSYDDLLAQVNAARQSIYPGNPDKIIPRRSDYYRHFRELASGYQGLLNIFDTPAQISSRLAGVSDFTTPRSKFLSFAQKREGEKTAVDAVGGFLDYIRSASYAKNIDPQIGKFRALGDELAAMTETGPAKGKLNNFIEFLGDWANDLSGKTNPIDRAVQKYIPGGRKTFRALDWINSRFKANAVLGNVSSSINQIFNVPGGIADAGPRNAALGAVDTLTSVFRPTTPMAESAFLKERYLASAFDKFDTGILKYPKQGATWMLTVMDEIGTKYIWNSEYRRALAEGVEDAVKFADDKTRAVVAGRGIGEVPLAQKSRFIQTLMPFQLEVANQWMLMKDWVDAKTYGKLVTLVIANHLFNNATEKLTGNRVGFDPLRALGDGMQAYEEEDDKTQGLTKAGGRLAGEVLSQLPGFNLIVAALPQNFQIAGMDKKEVFGQQDPTRYGAGSPLVKAFTGSLQGVTEGDFTDVITRFGLPFGGNQIRKMLGGGDALVAGGVYDDKHQLQFPVDNTLADKLKTIVFGKYATEEARFYFKEDLQSLSAKETQVWKDNVAAGKDPVLTWLAIEKVKLQTGFQPKVGQILRDPSLSENQKKEKLNALYEEFRVLNSHIDEFYNQQGISSPVTAPVTPPEQTKIPAPTLKGEPTVRIVGSGKKAKKPAYPTMPKLRQSAIIKGGELPQTEEDFDLTYLKQLGTMPELDLSFA